MVFKTRNTGTVLSSTQFTPSSRPPIRPRGISNLKATRMKRGAIAMASMTLCQSKMKLRWFGQEKKRMQSSIAKMSSMTASISIVAFSGIRGGSTVCTRAKPTLKMVKIGMIAAYQPAIMLDSGSSRNFHNGSRKKLLVLRFSNIVDASEATEWRLTLPAGPSPGDDWTLSAAWSSCGSCNSGKTNFRAPSSPRPSEVAFCGTVVSAVDEFEGQAASSWRLSPRRADVTLLGTSAGSQNGTSTMSTSTSPSGNGREESIDRLEECPGSRFQTAEGTAFLRQEDSYGSSCGATPNGLALLLAPPSALARPAVSSAPVWSLYASWSNLLSSLRSRDTTSSSIQLTRGCESPPRPSSLLPLTGVAGRGNAKAPPASLTHWNSTLRSLRLRRTLAVRD
mmetsp:Transcript_48316/g.154306  ORF Transcript_48316/g.154306 Transcript_48316/m.154306 type:complete len:394 (+) Transcript_48316:817-1998(+)